MAAKKLPQVIFLDHRILLAEPWLVEQLTNALVGQLIQHEGLSAFVRQTGERFGDYSVVWIEYKPEPLSVQLVGIPGRGAPAMVFTIFEKE